MDHDSISDALATILREVRALQSLLEKIAPTPLAGWVDPNPGDRSQKPRTSQPANEGELIDFCKRIEFCFKDHQEQFVDWRTTRSLVRDIDTQHGRECLKRFTDHCEERCRELGNRAIARPERIRAYFTRWLVEAPMEQS